MALFTYRGRARSLIIAGSRLTRGVPTELDGRAAEAAAAHPEIFEGDAEAEAAAPADPTAAIAEIAEYLDSENPDVAELTTKLVGLDEATLAKLAEEYDIAGPVEGAVLTDLAEAMLADGDDEDDDEAPEPLTGKELDDRIAELEIDAKTGGSNADGSMNADEKRAAIAEAEAEAAAAEAAAAQGGS